ncbi:Crp/Fnr family transcriptional regulator [Belliella sp. DSM 107340]|uniref:Crp/Fnr family transcriptional regulator n=1 Tax=Belliella calami TaxID=2923436 RepID=A0ABS9UKA1_9BACT|nr:Crp/Fnr family transcriptional regulator [Belliella calami]MCH7397054.1 Crp/Fnr family transcriptional regulator [Belliella calami]
MKDLANLIQEHFGGFTPQELKIIQTYFEEVKLQKNDFFTKTGKTCDKLGFVKSGILRVYTLSEGKEITQWISTENYLITEVMGFFFNQPNRWTIQALTETDLLLISKENYSKLCAELPKWVDVEKAFIMKCFAMLEDRVFSHLSMTADERFEQYFSQNPKLFNQVPLHYIASLLGMSAETFSRVRKRLTEKS